MAGPISPTGGLPGPATGAAGGDLVGTFPDPTLGSGVVALAEINATLLPSGSAADADEALRALGTAAHTAAAGNDGRLSDSRTPTAHKTTHEPGGSDALTLLDNSSLKALAGIAYSKLSLSGAVLNTDLAGGITYAKLSLSAGDIPYTKLTLTGSVVNADVATGAAIAYSKLNLTGAVLNTDLAGGITYAKLGLSAGDIPYLKLNLTGSIVNVDISTTAGISYSKLVLTGAILNADLAGSIAYSKLVLTGAILNSDLAGSIAYSKLVLTGAILNADLAGSIAYSKLVLTGAILNADLAGSIAYSKLTLTGAILGTDLSSTIAIPSGATGTTQTAGDNSTKLSTTAYTDTSTGGRVIDFYHAASKVGTTDGVIAQSFNVDQAGNNGSGVGLTNQRLTCSAVVLKKGMVIKGHRLYVFAAGGTVTSSAVGVATYVQATDTLTVQHGKYSAIGFTSANSLRSSAFTGNYTVPSDGVYYLFTYGNFGVNTPATVLTLGFNDTAVLQMDVPAAWPRLLTLVTTTVPADGQTYSGFTTTATNIVWQGAFGTPV